MESQLCRNRGISKFGFLDPNVYNENTVKFKSTTEFLAKNLIHLQDKERIFLAYQSANHYVLFDIHLEGAKVTVYDSKEREDEYIQPFLDCLNK